MASPCDDGTPSLDEAQRLLLDVIITQMQRMMRQNNDEDETIMMNSMEELNN